MVGKIARLGSTYTAGQGLFPFEEWNAMIQDNTVQAIDRTNDVPASNLSNPLQYVFGRVISVAGFSDTCAMRSFAKSMVSDGDRNETRTLPQDRFIKLVDETAAALCAAGLIGENDPVPFADIPFHRAAKKFSPSPMVYIQYILRHCHARRFFITDGGYMGLASAEAQAGDEIHIFVGVGFPFILRRAVDDVISEEGLRLHKLVGESYVEERVWKELQHRGSPAVTPVTIV